MVKILLVGINAKYIHSNPAVYSLRAYALKDKRLEGMIDIAEYTTNMRKEIILSSLYRKKPDVIGLSTYIWNVSLVCELIKDISEIMPDVHIYLGGPEASYDAESYLEKYPAVKGVMVGEGEETFKMLAERYYDLFCTNDNDGPDGSIAGQLGLLTDFDLSDISGLFLRSGYKENRTLVKMDDLKFFYEDESDSQFANRIIYYESSRGCPFRCSYCLSSIDKTTRFRSISTVKADLDYFIGRKVKQVKFIDRTFNCNHDRTKEIWSYITENDNGITNFHFEIAADLINDEVIELIGSMRPGLIQLEIGVQTTNPATLSAINRPTDINHIAEVVDKIIKFHNAHVHLDLIAGLPYEDFESFRNSFNEVYAMKPNQLQLGFLKVLKGSPIENETEKYDIHYSQTAPYEVLSTKWISYGDILILKNIEEMVETFYNSSQFNNSLPFIQSFFETPFDMFAFMADYYERNDYYVKLPARSRKYEILIEMMGEIADSGAVEKLRELLTLDYYLREKPKSKPDFVKELPNVQFDYTRRDPITGNYYII